MRGIDPRRTEVASVIRRAGRKAERDKWDEKLEECGTNPPWAGVWIYVVGSGSPSWVFDRSGSSVHVLKRCWSSVEKP